MKRRLFPGAKANYINPEDGDPGGIAQKKRQFSTINQHYISHNVVLPAPDLQIQEKVSTKNQQKDPNAFIPLKPNYLSSEAN